MKIPTDLECLGRAFIQALVDRLGYAGAGGVLVLLPIEMKMAAERELPGREDSLNG